MGIMITATHDANLTRRRMKKKRSTDYTDYTDFLYFL
jgi:hypothetical protein